MSDDPSALRIAEALAWAADYYPAKATPPPDLSILTLDDVCAVFEQCPSLRAHLALVDQEAIRRWVKDPQCRAALRSGWSRYGV